MLINIFHGFTEGCRVMQVSGSQPIWGASHSPAVLHCLYQPIALLGPTGGPDLGLCVEPVLRTSGGVRYISGCQARRRRDLGAAVGERGRYGVPVGGVVAVGGGRACAGHPHGLGLAAGTGWQGPYIQLVLQSCRDRKWARSRFASGVGRLYVRPLPLDRAEGVGIAKLPIGELINLSCPMGNLVVQMAQAINGLGKSTSLTGQKLRRTGNGPPFLTARSGIPRTRTAATISTALWARARSASTSTRAQTSGQRSTLQLKSASRQRAARGAAARVPVRARVADRVS